MKITSLKLFFLFSFFIVCHCSFQESIFKELNKNLNGKNLLVSPTSIFQILSLTTNGANGLTQKEMLNALQNSDISLLNSVNYKILNHLKNFSTFEFANAVMTNFVPEKQFSKICKNYFSTVEPLKSVEQVNNWCNQKTHGKITEIIDKFPSLTQMILINAVYFKGLWKYEFKKKQTQLKSFYNLNRQEIKVETMNIMAELNYYHDSNVEAVELPYKEDGMSAVIILPNKNLDINNWIADMSNNKNNLYSIIGKLHKVKLDLELPKFELEYGEKLNEALKNLGIKSAFDNADFDGLKQGSNLYIGYVAHKSYLKVDEEGTEGAAATIVVIRTHSRPRIYRMQVNRPFLFLIKSSLLPRNYDLLFMAKVEKLK